MDSPLFKKHQAGGLSHLMEAATAIARLTESDSLEEASTAAASAKPEEEAEAFVVSDKEGRKKLASSSTNIKRVIFPQQLLSILSDKSLSDVVTWLPHGRSFVIIRPDVFTEEVLPKYLPPVDARASTKYPSFTRKLNRWGFRQETRGADTGAFHHPHFRRDQPSLCLDLVCKRSRDQKIISSNSCSCSPSRLPLKKRMHSDDSLSNKKVAPLTKESLAAMDPPESQTPSDRALATVSVTDDSRSATSHSSSSSSSSSLSSTTLQPCISKDNAFVEGVLKEREQAESMRVAKTMLYQAYLQALHAE